jgi:transcriptional regulator with XRE-family HTH domain
VRRKFKSLAEYFEQTKDTQGKLARRLGVSRSYVSLLTSGDRQPALDLALRIQKETGVPSSALVSVERVA